MPTKDFVGDTSRNIYSAIRLLPTFCKHSTFVTDFSGKFPVRGCRGRGGRGGGSALAAPAGAGAATAAIHRSVIGYVCLFAPRLPTRSKCLCNIILWTEGGGSGGVLAAGAGGAVPHIFSHKGGLVQDEGALPYAPFAPPAPPPAWSRRIWQTAPGTDLYCRSTSAQFRRITYALTTYDDS